MHRVHLSAAVSFMGTVAIVAPACRLAAQQSDVSMTPFVSLPQTAGTGTTAGLVVTVAGNPGFGLRVSGRSALRNTYTGTFSAASMIPPWGADADAVVPLSGRPFGASNRSPSTFVFIGLGASAVDTADTRVVTRNWSYGVGTALPLGSRVDLFADSRWRMQRFVLPTASPRPERTKEIRFGLTFHVGGVGDGRTTRRGR